MGGAGEMRVKRIRPCAGVILKMSLAYPVPDELATALAAYRNQFGHAVPAEVVQLYAVRVGPLVMEIRQAVALRKPVPAWLARSRLPSPTLHLD
jgi:hypothetical protein